MGSSGWLLLQGQGMTEFRQAYTDADNLSMQWQNLYSFFQRTDERTPVPEYNQYNKRHHRKYEAADTTSRRVQKARSLHHIFSMACTFFRACAMLPFFLQESFPDAHKPRAENDLLKLHKAGR